jgi:hypothetical protein
LETEYYIYSLKANGWLSRGGIWSSEVADAHPFSRDVAIARCKRFKDADGSLLAVPVLIEDVKEVAAA